MPVKTKSTKRRQHRTIAPTRPPEPAPNVVIPDQSQVFPAEAMFIVIGQALQRLMKGVSPEVPNTLSDSEGSVWHAHADYKHPRVKVFCRKHHHSKEATVQGWYLALSDLNQVLLKVKPIEYEDGKEVNA